MATKVKLQVKYGLVFLKS